jgi:hypothetical protein
MSGLQVAATTLEEMNQSADQLPFAGGSKLIEVLERPVPLTPPNQGAGVAENDQLGTRPCHRLSECPWPTTKGDGSVRVATGQTQKHHGRLAVAKRGGNRDFDGILEPGEGRILVQQATDQLGLGRIESQYGDCRLPAARPEFALRVAEPQFLDETGESPDDGLRFDKVYKPFLGEMGA